MCEVLAHFIHQRITSQIDIYLLKCEKERHEKNYSYKDLKLVNGDDSLKSSNIKTSILHKKP
jgi:hypothetical protein